MVSNSSINEDNRTVDITWTTGSKGLRRGWGGDYYEELSLDPSHVDLTRLNDGSHPFLAVHNDQDLDAVIGVVERAWLEGDKAGATVRFARDEISERAFMKVKDGILRNISVGYSVSEYTDVSQADDKIPTYRATRWQPAELSLVPIGFDSSAKVRNQEQVENEVEIIGRSEISTNDEETSEMSKVNQPAAEPQIDAEALKMEAAQAERKRGTEIRSLVRNAELNDSLAEDMIERGLSVDEAKKNVESFKRAIEETNKTMVNTNIRVEVGATDTDKKRDAAVEALLYRVDGNLFKPEQGNPFLGVSMIRMMEDIQGGRYGKTPTLVARHAMSSSDLPYILSNVAEKGAQKKYQLQPRTWERWAKKATLRNFKTHDQLRSGDFASLLERQENGEFKQGSFGEEREQVALKEWGIKLAFTRRSLINDDLSEITKVIAQSGVAASRLENRLVYEQLTGSVTMGDGTALFHADHGNLCSAGALTDSEIGEAFEKMRAQTSVDGLDKLNLTPKYLICGPANEVTARKYLATISPTQASNVNVFSGSLELIVDSEITSDDYFFAADQNLIDTVVLFHLEGEEAPRVETRINFDTEAFELKVAHNAVAKAMDWRGLVKNGGAS